MLTIIITLLIIYLFMFIFIPKIYYRVPHPILVPRFRKPDNYLCSRALKRPSSTLRRSATAPTGVANMKNETHQESIFQDASAFVKRGLTIKRLRSGFYQQLPFWFYIQFSNNSMQCAFRTDTASISIAHDSLAVCEVHPCLTACGVICDLQFEFRIFVGFVFF